MTWELDHSGTMVVVRPDMQVAWLMVEEDWGLARDLLFIKMKF